MYALPIWSSITTTTKRYTHNHYLKAGTYTAGFFANIACQIQNFVYRRTMEMDDVVKAFGALAQETRLKILELLVSADKDGMAAGDIALALGVPQNTLSFHLNQLEYADIITRRRAGRFIIYSVNRDGMKSFLHYIVQNCIQK